MIWFLRRLLQVLLSLWLLATITFFLMRAFPGSPFDDEVTLHPDVRAQLERQYDLGKSASEQYLKFLGGLVQGNFGTSQFFAGQDAKDIILHTFPVTLTLALGALLLAILAGALLSFWAVLSRPGYLAYEVITLSFLSTPILLAGPLLILVFGFRLNILPVALLESPLSYILPIIAVSLRPMASISRLLYTNLSDNHREDFLRTSRALGFSEVQILLKWNLRNSLVPLLAYLGPLAAVLMAGSTMVEVVFGIPGLGSQFVESVLNRDSSMVIGLTLFYGFFILIFQLVVDVLVAVLDPRVRADQ